MHDWKTQPGGVKSASSDFATPVSSGDTVEVATPPAPGLKGPKGMAPKTNYSRVHATPPQVSDTGAAAQKALSAPPLLSKVGSHNEVTMAREMFPGPSLSEMLSAARSGASFGSSSTKLASEAAELLGKTAGEDDQDDDDEDEKKERLSGKETAKLAAAGRAAIHALGLELAKQAEELSMRDRTGNPPIEQKPVDGPPVKPQGHAATNPPMGPTHEGTSEMSAATHVQTDFTARPGGDTPQQVPGGAKTAGALLRSIASQKLAADDGMSGPAPTSGSGGAVTKSNGSSPTTPERWDGPDAGPPAKDKGKVPATAAGVQAFKPRDGVATPKQEAAQLLDEPMMNRQTDGTLHNAFEHTDEAGAKVSHLVKRAAGKALLNRLAHESRRN